MDVSSVQNEIVFNRVYDSHSYLSLICLLLLTDSGKLLFCCYDHFMPSVECPERQQQNRERDAKLFGSGSTSSAPASAACQVSVVDDSCDKTDGKPSCFSMNVHLCLRIWDCCHVIHHTALCLSVQRSNTTEKK